MTMLPGMLRVAPLWFAPEGKVGMSGKWGEVRILVLPNKSRRPGSNQPDMFLYFAPPVPLHQSRPGAGDRPMVPEREPDGE